jgi:vacuolar-type H+-ATPase subunit H
MLQENYPQGTKTQFDESSVATNVADTSYSEFNIEVELDRLKELILNSSHIPFTELAIVDDDLLLEQILHIQENLPTELATAIEIVKVRHEIIADAQSYAYSLVKSAEEKAHQIVQESVIVRQAELDGGKLRLKTEQECDQLRQNAIAECQAIQMDADHYADNVLGDLENKLQQMLDIIHNGRQQLNQ